VYSSDDAPGLLPGSTFSSVFVSNRDSMILFLKRLDAIQAALSNYLITFFGLPIAAIWLREKLTTAAIAGGVLVRAGTLLITV
jgi:drug/metabolite transporter (DMT)-like permease